MSRSAFLIVMLYLVFSLALASCTPPGAQPLGDIDTPVKETQQPEEQTQPEETQQEAEEAEQEEPEEESLTEGLEEATEFSEKSVDCVTGYRECKDTKLIECRSGKLVRKEDCGSRGCFVDHCGECDPDVPLECQGNKLVKCTKDARKITTNCYECSNNACVDPPEVPEPLECSSVVDMTTDESFPLSVYSAFKKSEVDQELGVFNHVEDDGNELGRMFANGAYDDVKSNKGKSPIYLQIERCYIYCDLQQALEVEIQCEDKTVTATIPPHQAAAANPLRFFVGVEGSTFYGDTDKNGQGQQMDIEDIFKKDNVAVKAKI